MKKINAFTILFSFSIIICVLMSGCAVYLDVFEEDYTEWYTEGDTCGFIVTINNDSAYGYFTFDDIKVRTYYQVTPTYSLQLTFPYSEDLNILTELNGARYEVEYGTCGGVMEGLLDGDVFHVSSFRVGYTEIGPFDMYSRKVDAADINARDYTACTWTANDNSITIENAIYGFDEYSGSITVNGETQPIYFKWCDNNRFEIYNGEDGTEECIVLASGSYTNVALELSLAFEYDDTFGLQGQMVNLTGIVI